MGKPIIEIKNLAKIFSVNRSALTVFENLSYQVEKGGFLSIVGPVGLWEVDAAQAHLRPRRADPRQQSCSTVSPSPAPPRA